MASPVDRTATSQGQASPSVEADSSSSPVRPATQPSAASPTASVGHFNRQLSNESHMNMGPNTPQQSHPPPLSKEQEYLLEQQRYHQPGPGEGSSTSPPPYSIPSVGSPAELHQEQVALQQAAPQGPPRYTGLPRIDYRLYSPAWFELLPDTTGIKTTAPHFSHDAAVLSQLIRTQATVPPKPIIIIRGNRGRKVDFDVKCNLMPLLVPEEKHARLDYLRCVSKGELAMRGSAKPVLSPHVPDGDDPLDGWIKLYLKDQSHAKLFTLERQVANLDINFLEGQIRTMVSSTGYKGVVTVKFPVLHAKVIVQSPDRVNKFFTTVSTLFTGKSHYEVVKAVWPFATHRSGEAQRRCVVQTEEAWWREWRDSLKYAIATKRTGWVTNEDKLEAIMEGKGKGVSAVDWGPDFD